MASTPKKKIVDRFVGPFQIMAVLLVGTYAVLPLLPDHDTTNVVELALAAVLCSAMLLGIRASGCRRAYVVAAQAIVALIAVGIAADSFGTRTYDAPKLLFALLALVGIWTILASVLRTERVDTDKIFAAICVLFLLGWFWSYIYVVVDAYSDGLAFGGIAHASGEPGEGYTEADRDLTYFSFVTLTTLGYGDVVPKTPFARVLATLQALTGQLYLAILVARLVALQIVHSKKEAQE